MKTTTSPTIFLWWWCLWWCGGGGGWGVVAGVVETSESPTERNENQQQETLPLISEEESQLIIRRKLHETAANFERHLKTQLNGVETEIYAEFLSILETLGDTQGNLTQEMSEKLRRERLEVLKKVNKVTRYSSFLVETLYNNLKKLLNELGVWTVEDPIDRSFLDSHHLDLLGRKHDSDSSPSSSDDTYRSKRHMIDWDFDTSSDSSSSSSSDETYVSKGHRTDWDFDSSSSSSSSSSYSSENAYRSKRHMINWDSDSDPDYDTRAQNLAKYEPTKEEDMEKIPASFDHMNSLQGPQDDLDTTLPDWTTPQATGNPESPRGEMGPPPRDCLDLLQRGMAHDGVYTIYPKGLGVRAWCDMSSVGGGWTVVAGRRAHQPEVNFSRPLLHYQFGFGDPENQHWLGLDHMHALTRATNSTLRVVLHHYALPAPLHATYQAFSVGSREDGHRLTVEGYDPSSTAADALSPHSGAPFTCPDPRYSGNSCVGEVEAGWWFLEAPLCYLALPTGLAAPPEPGRGVRGTLAWLGLQYSPETFLLMIRREGESG